MAKWTTLFGMARTYRRRCIAEREPGTAQRARGSDSDRHAIVASTVDPMKFRIAFDRHFATIHRARRSDRDACTRRAAVTDRGASGPRPHHVRVGRRRPSATPICARSPGSSSGHPATPRPRQLPVTLSADSRDLVVADGVDVRGLLRGDPASSTSGTAITTPPDVPVVAPC
jgi:hypothetical protein